MNQRTRPVKKGKQKETDKEEETAKEQPVRAQEKTREVETPRVAAAVPQSGQKPVEPVKVV